MTVDVPPGTIILRRDRLLLRWPDGEVALTPADLRAACRCAECRSASLRGTRRQGDEIKLTGAAPVGSYALQLTFSDHHDRGVYPWSLLRELSDRPRYFSDNTLATA